MNKILVLAFLSFLFNCFSVAQVNVTARFDILSTKVIPDYIFGINVFQGFDPNQAGFPGNTSYKNALSDMNPGIIRYHSWEMFGSGKNSWIDSNKDWNASKISNALKDSYPMKPAKMINIPSWPDGKFGVNVNDTLPKSKYQDFANWCAELVKICNIDNTAGIQYWEILNERDDTYNNNHAELAVIFNQCAEAMKKVDPSIKVGGPAFAQAWVAANVEAFCKGTSSTLDFISYHSYTTGNSNETNQNIYNGADIGWVTGTVKSAWKKYSNRTIEFFHNEYNISYNPPDAKQTNYVSQIFDAIAMISLINSGASGGMAWNECDGWYGKMDNSYNKRPSFYLFENFNNQLRGNMVYTTQVSDTKKIVALSSKNDSCYYIVLANRADADVSITLSFKGLPSSVTSTTMIHNYENQKSGGIVIKTLTFSELTSTGFTSKSGTIALLCIPKDSPVGLRSNFTNSEDLIQIYPNPSTEKIFITIPNQLNGTDFVIRDMTGRSIDHFILYESQSVDINKYSKGTYFLDFNIDGKRVSKLLVKY